MDNDVIEVTNETRKKLRDFDEQEAYFLLCEIFSHAQATKDYAKFQSDLSEWKKRFAIDLFSEEYRRKIKYMLSKEFLDTVLKNFTAFDELSKKDPSKGLEKLRKILDKAENHKDAKQLDKDLDALYLEYPLKFLKEKYPHVVGQLLSKSNRTRILEKFDSALAFKELNNIIEKPQNYNDADDFKAIIEEWQKLYPTADFNDKFRGQVEQLLNETLDERNLEKLFPTVAELDLSEGQVIPIELQHNISKLNKDALHDFFKIVDKNKGDINSLFDWTCKYSRYINSFDSTTKTSIVDNLMMKYAYELPPTTTYQIPKMESGINDLLSLADFNSIDDTKKQAVLQLLGVLSTGHELTNDDIYRLEIINSNVQKVQMIENSKIEQKLDWFIDKFPENKLTPSDEIYFAPASNTCVDVEIENDVDITLHNDGNDNIVVEEEQIHDPEPTSFKTSLKIEKTLERINSDSTNSGTSDAGTASGGSAVSISSNEAQKSRETVEEVLDEDDTADKDAKEENEPSIIESEIVNNLEPEVQDTPVILSDIENNLEDTPVVSTNSENISGDTISIEEPTIDDDTPEQKEEPPHENPVQNFFKRFLRRETTNTIEDDERDDR